MTMYLNENKALSSEELSRILFKRYYPLTARKKGIVLTEHEKMFLDATLYEIIRASNFHKTGNMLVTVTLQSLLDSDLLGCIEAVVTEQYDAFQNPQLQKVLTLCDVVRVYETSKTQYTIDMHHVQPHKEFENLDLAKNELYDFQSMVKIYKRTLTLTQHDFRKNELDYLIKLYEVLILSGQQTVHDAVLRAVVRSRANYRTIAASDSRSDTLNSVLTAFSQTIDEDYLPMNLSPEFCLAPIGLKLFYDKYIKISENIDRSSIHFANYFEDKLLALYDNSLLSITREYFGKQHCTDAYFLTKNSIILEARENAFLPLLSAELVDAENLAIASELRLGVHIPDAQKIIRVIHEGAESARF